MTRKDSMLAVTIGQQPETSGETCVGRAPSPNEWSELARRAGRMQLRDENGRGRIPVPGTAG
jgi:hypothetical protein